MFVEAKAVEVEVAAADFDQGFHRALAYLRTTTSTTPYQHPYLGEGHRAKAAIVRSLNQAV